ncbi:MAG: helix-turn-helix transcriptional regulator [Dehalococcoidia bacterium]
MTNIPQDEPVFAISVVSRMIGIHQQTLRSYERIGLVRPARSPGNTRLYSTRDVERLQQVLRLMNDLGVNLAGVEVILGMRQQIEQLQRDLAETRAAVEQLRGRPGGGGGGGGADGGSVEGQARRE